MTTTATQDTARSEYTAATAALAARAGAAARDDASEDVPRSELVSALVNLLAGARAWLAVRAELAVLTLLPEDTEPIGIDVPDKSEADTEAVERALDDSAERLESWVVNSLTFEGSTAYLDAGEAHGFNSWRWVADVDACDRCQQLDGEEFSTAFDALELHHPSCRCEVELFNADSGGSEND